MEHPVRSSQHHSGFGVTPSAYSLSTVARDNAAVVIAADSLRSSVAKNGLLTLNDIQQDYNPVIEGAQ